MFEHIVPLSVSSTQTIHILNFKVRKTFAGAVNHHCTFPSSVQSSDKTRSYCSSFFPLLFISYANIAGSFRLDPLFHT